jgi:asparagine synthase (glutamine-hydrolysing)
MCGIAGAYGFPGLALAPMLTAMRHRGPDDSGIFRDERVVMGMTRLAVIDPSQAAHQPMTNEQGSIWIVYNGEVYNFLEERQRLMRSGARFRSDSDTEVILKLYEIHGDDFVLRLRGMFALAIYDRRKGQGRERLLLARDPLGIKPLLYTQNGGTLLFASELKALLASGRVPAQTDPDAIRTLLTFGSIPQPATAIRNVQMLPAAHRLIAEKGSSRLERYWTLGEGREPGAQIMPYEQAVERVRAEVEHCLRLQLTSDVPLGAFLSGGIDSSILVGLMSSAAVGRVKTFSIGFTAEGAEMDETESAGRTAKFFGTDHHREEVTGRDVRSNISDIASALDQPSFDGVNAYFVSRAARRRVTVAVSGTGGDELFAGYPWFRSMAQYAAAERTGTGCSSMARVRSALARSRMFDHLIRTPAGGRLEKYRAQCGFLPRFARQHQSLGAQLATRLMSAPVRESTLYGRDLSLDIRDQDQLSHASAVRRVTALCLRGYTQNQLLRDIDAVSMFHSLEVRVPFLDHVLVDLALSLPDESKLGPLALDGEGPDASYQASGAKRILIDAFRGLIPSGLERQPKRGFSLPYAAWLRGPLHEVMEDTLSVASVNNRGLFDSSEVNKVRSSFEAGKAPWTHPWTLMMCELWHREVIDGNNPSEKEQAKV